MEKWIVPQGATDKQLNRLLAIPAQRLRAGGLIAFPTETVYGLGANALSEAAVQGIFRAKRRPADNPLIVHLADAAQLSNFLPRGFVLPELVKTLIHHFWPGPLTILLPADERLAPSVHPNLATVGFRVPSHPVAQALLRLADCPIAAPSANLSGRPSPTCAADVEADLAAELDGLVDGGSCEVGVESTVVEVTDKGLFILRPGGVTKEMLAAVTTAPVQADSPAGSDDAPRAPGMKYRHYAPNAEVSAWWGAKEAVIRAIVDAVDARLTRATSPIGILAPVSFSPALAKAWPTSQVRAVYLTGAQYDVDLAQTLYHQLRVFDEQHAELVCVVGVDPRKGIGNAIMNRLQKATEGRVFGV